MCHTDKEQANPSRSTVIEFVLPLKIHIRYCWLFSGVPWCNTKRLGNRAGPLTNRELLCVNRTLMTGEEPELLGHTWDEIPYHQDTLKAFWLTTNGRLVYVDRFSEDIKFRRLRQQNLRVTLSLWTTNPELCGQMIRASKSAHGNLIKICGEAALLSRGRFYNLYANYPLPINADGKEDILLESHWVDEKDIKTKDIRNGGEFLLELQPLYTAYFSFIADNSTSDKLRDRVSLLGAQWLIHEDCSELQFSLTLKRNWFTRSLIRLALFLSIW